MLTTWPCQSTTARVTCRMARRAAGSLNESKISAASSKSLVGPGSAASVRRPATPRWRRPGSVSTRINSSNPGVVIARIAGVTSGPRPPVATSTSRSVRSGNW